MITGGKLFSVPPTSIVLTLGYDRATPEQISLRCPLILSDSAVATATAEYKPAGAITWSLAGPLYRIKLSELGTLPADLVGRVGDSFVGWITGLTPGTTYDVRVRVNQPGLIEQIIEGTRATRTLPATAPAVTKTCTTATFASVLATLVPGDHLRLAAGTYTLAATLGNVPGGTLAQPIYITAAAIGDVTFARATGTALAPNSDYVVWERVRFTGSGTDSGVSVTSQFCNPNTGRRNVGWCFRYCEITGFDAAFKCFEPVDDFLVYECLIYGNNNWAATYGSPVNATWDDSGLQFPGSGNACWANTIRGFGDTFRCHTSAGIRFTAGNYYWRNRVEWGGDNALEADDAAGNVAAYDNLITNSGDMLSVDGTYGPTGFFRNICINTTRGPIKVTSLSRGTRIESNTWVITTKTTTHGLLTPSATGQYGLTYRNNLFVYSGTGNLVHWSSPMFGETWSNNAWTDGIIFINGTGTYASVGVARVGNPARFALDVVVPAQPFATAITMGSDYTTQINGTPTAVLAASSTARNVGAVIPGITDGYSGSAPDIGAVITGRVAVQFGRTPTDASPSWLTALAAGRWGTVPASNTASSVDPANDPLANPNYPSSPPWNTSAGGTVFASGGFSRTMTAWNGACFDSVGARLHINAAGGHTDYFGNSSYRLDLNLAAPVWVRYSNPSILPTYSGGEGTGRYSDGRARSAHTYLAPVYVPGLGPIVANQQAMATSGTQGAGEVVSFDEATGVETFWAASITGGGAGSSACWDGDLGVVWHRPHGSQAMRKWNRFSTPQHTVVGGIIAWNGAASMMHMPGLGCLLVGNGDDTTAGPGVPSQSQMGGWAVFDTSTGTLHTPTFTGAPTSLNQPTLGVWPGTAQPMWDATRRCAYVWDKRSSTTQIVRLTPGSNPRTDAWVIDTIPVSGSNTVTPTVAQTPGTFGRAWFWRDCVFVVNAVDQPVYFFKVA